MDEPTLSSPQLGEKFGNEFRKNAFSFIRPSATSLIRLDEKLDDGLDEKVGERRATILRTMAKNPSITVSNLSKLLGISRNATDKNIQFLKDKGWIKRIGPAKGGHWEVTD